MALTALQRRLRDLEQMGEMGLPLYIRQWLGEPLSADQHARANREWAEAQAQPPASPDQFSAEVRDWLFKRRASA